jgi:GT2 family glycosyltransferase/glycosyltransferase involved in cell wall biosynthesis
VSTETVPRPGLHRLEPTERIALERGRPVICIPVYGRADLFSQCLRSVLEHTANDVPILVADDASPDPAIVGLLEDLDAQGVLAHGVYVLRQPANVGFVANMNMAFAACEPGDPVIVNSDVVVAEGWLEGLRDAAHVDTRTASASALTNYGTILSVPLRNESVPTLPQSWTLEAAAAAIRQRSLRLRPEIPTAVGHCVYIRRMALDLVGAFDEGFSPGYGEEVDFSQRCLLHGLRHVAADDVFVFHQGKGSFSAGGSQTQEDHQKLIEARYPYYEDAVREVSNSVAGPLPRALSAARRSLRGLSVTIDARILGPYVTGTQIVVLELIQALSEVNGLRVRALLPAELGDYASSHLAELERVERVELDGNGALERTDIAHRPYQVACDDDLDLLVRLGERIVISQLDLIAYANPGYFPDFKDWDAYRRVTRRALETADQVLFISRGAAEEALRAELVDDERVAVAYPGADHRLHAERPEPKRPRNLGRLDQPFLLVLGTDYRHKNRMFVLRLLEELCTRHLWDGALVLAGPHVAHGSSAGDEAAFLASRPELAARVHEVAAVTESEKRWLLEETVAVVYPTVYEGFGLVPFEAAAAGAPCLFAPHTSLSEILPEELAQLVPWDPTASAERALPLLQGSGRDQLVDLVGAAAARYTWRRCAEQTMSAYERAVTRPARPSLAPPPDVLELQARAKESESRAEESESRAEESESRYSELVDTIGEDGMSLVGPDGILPAKIRRPLLAISVRRWLRAPIFALIRLPYQIVFRLSHGGRSEPEG